MDTLKIGQNNCGIVISQSWWEFGTFFLSNVLFTEPESECKEQPTFLCHTSDPRNCLSILWLNGIDRPYKGTNQAMIVRFLYQLFPTRQKSIFHRISRTTEQRFSVHFLCFMSVPSSSAILSLKFLTCIGRQACFRYPLMKENLFHYLQYSSSSVALSLSAQLCNLVSGSF